MLSPSLMGIINIPNTPPFNFQGAKVQTIFQIANFLAIKFLKLVH